MTFAALDSDLTGPLFATEAMREVFSDRSRVAAMLQAEAALARAEANNGLAPRELAPAIEAIAADTLDIPALGRDTALAGVPTIPFVKAVQARLPKELERAFHKGATTQDIVDTALVLQVRDAFGLVESDLSATIEALAALARRHRRTPCIGRTYGQHAAPVTFGYKVAIWRLGLAEVADALPALRTRVLMASLAGPVGTLAGLGDKGAAVADAFAMALDLGLAPAAWHTRRARMAEIASWLAILIGALAKIAGDVASLATTEIGEVAEPYQPGRGGSSAMPHKRNPVGATVILAAQAAAPGHVVTMLNAMAAEHERPAGLWHGEWHALPQLFGLVSGAIREARRLAEGLEVHADRMLANIGATGGLVFADAASSLLATTLGRETAHRLVEEAANEVRRTGGKLRDVLAKDPRLANAGGVLERAFDMEGAIEAAADWTDRALAPATRKGEVSQ